MTLVSGAEAWSEYYLAPSPRWLFSCPNSSMNPHVNSFFTNSRNPQTKIFSMPMGWCDALTIVYATAISRFAVLCTRRYPFQRNDCDYDAFHFILFCAMGPTMSKIAIVNSPSCATSVAPLLASLDAVISCLRHLQPRYGSHIIPSWAIRNLEISRLFVARAETDDDVRWVRHGCKSWFNHPRMHRFLSSVGDIDTTLSKESGRAATLPGLLGELRATFGIKGAQR